MDERYLESRQRLESIFVPEHRVPRTETTYLSPSGKYWLDICNYASGRPNTLGCSRGIVTRLVDGKVIADVKRNLLGFWHKWLTHPNGNEYLLCGEHYQGYSVVNLTQNQYHVCLPHQVHSGSGWCWHSVRPSPDGLVLAVSGCLWADRDDVLLYDFRDPDTLPLPQLACFYCTDAIGWLDNATFEMSREIQIRKSDRVPYDDLSEEEQEILDEDESLVEEIRVAVYHKRERTSP